MSWFGEQLEERKKKDTELFENAFQNLPLLSCLLRAGRRWRMISRRRRMRSKKF